MDPENRLSRILTHTSSGSTVNIRETGATILAFHPSPEHYCETLFLSRDAVLDGIKAIRGGIPIVFPIFGPPSNESDMPQHGFARTSQWKCDPASLVDNETEASVEYTLVVDK
jgi:glucose-6-phosphate 1-epimerase